MKKNNDKTLTKNKEEKVFDNVRIQWDIRIFRKVSSNHWKYWFFDIEIFTFFIEGEELWKINMNFL